MSVFHSDWRGQGKKRKKEKKDLLEIQYFELKSVCIVNTFFEGFWRNAEYHAMVFKLLKCFRPNSLLLKWVLMLNASQINQSKGTDHINSGTFPATSPPSCQVLKHMLRLRRRSPSHWLQAPLSCMYILYASGLVNVSLEEDPSFIGGPSS